MIHLNMFGKHTKKNLNVSKSLIKMNWLKLTFIYRQTIYINWVICNNNCGLYHIIIRTSSNKYISFVLEDKLVDHCRTGIIELPGW